VKQIKVSDDVHEQISKIAEKYGISINDVVKMLLNLYLGGTGERSIDKIYSKEFVTDSEKVCSKCKRKIGIGEIVYWVKYVYLDGSATTRYFCIECANPHLAKIYKKKKEMEIVVKQLKQEADRLVEEINKLEQVESIYTIKNEVIQLWRAFKSTFTDNPDYKVVDQFFDKLNELFDKVNRLEMVGEEIKKDIRIIRREKAKTV